MINRRMPVIKEKRKSRRTLARRRETRTCQGPRTNFTFLRTSGSKKSSEVTKRGHRLNFRLRRDAAKVTIPYVESEGIQVVCRPYRDVCKTPWSQMSRTKLFTSETPSTWIVFVASSWGWPSIVIPSLSIRVDAINLLRFGL